MSQNQITEIQEVSSVSSSTSYAPTPNLNHGISKTVHFHHDFDTVGIQKISEFIDIHKLSLEHFWKSEKQYFGYDDINEMCNNIGLKLDGEDEVDLKETIFHTNLVISIHQFKNYIRSWNNYSTAKVNQFLQSRTGIFNDSIFKGKSLMSNDKKKQRPQSSISINRKLEFKYQNKSMEYLRLQKVKAKQQENKLIQAINKAKNQEQYQVLIKMGEANDLNKQMQSFYTYRAYKNAQGNLKVKKQINLQQFQRQFNTIKKKYNQSKNTNVWDMLATGASKNPGSQLRQISNLSKKNMKVADRQRKKRKLVQILSQTINLTNVFKQQLRILKAQGIGKK